MIDHADGLSLVVVGDAILCRCDVADELSLAIAGDNDELSPALAGSAGETILL